MKKVKIVSAAITTIVTLFLKWPVPAVLSLIALYWSLTRRN